MGQRANGGPRWPCIKILSLTDNERSKKSISDAGERISDDYLAVRRMGAASINY